MEKISQDILSINMLIIEKLYIVKDYNKKTLLGRNRNDTL